MATTPASDSAAVRQPDAWMISCTLRGSTAWPMRVPRVITPIAWPRLRTNHFATVTPAARPSKPEAVPRPRA